jgi:hypothetical protein
MLRDLWAWVRPRPVTTAGRIREQKIVDRIAAQMDAEAGAKDGVKRPEAESHG